MDKEMSGWIGRMSTEYAWLDLNLNIFLLMVETLCKFKYIYFEMVEYYLSNMKHKAETKHNNGLS